MKTTLIWQLVAGVCAGVALPAFAAEEETTTTATVTVTGTREAQSLSQTPASVGVIGEASLRKQMPVHPSQVMGQIPGVWVNITGGEGHQTAIRQPLTTSPVYLYLEDGIPTRSTGFFNHNALYEINMPMAGGIEVNKGPGTALYGSDAIGGVINVLTRPSPLKPEAEVSLDIGQYGWRRLMASGGNTWGNDGLRGDLNLTATDGWRDATDYRRESGTVRWDRAIGGSATLKTVATYSNIDQQTAGSSALSYDDYKHNPTINYTPISFRKVTAFRLSSAYEREMGDSLISVTPYFRHNDMDLLANWSLGYDPTVYNTSNYSIGLMSKYRRDFAPLRARVIVGLDLDRSPGSRFEQAISTTTTGSGINKTYIGYTVGATAYDYDVTYQGMSPYLHGEISPGDKLRVTGGLRFDQMSYQYDNHLADGAYTVGSKTYGHAGDMTRDFSHLSPKLAATYAFTPTISGFAAYNHAFRAPSEGQLFRPGTGTSVANADAAAHAAASLKPVKVDSYEIGMRNQNKQFSYELSVYYMTKTDDIVTYQANASAPRLSQNAGETKHRGVEIGIGAALTSALRLNVGYSHAKHSYTDWVNNTANFSGKEMELAPRNIANTRLSFAPGNWQGGAMTLEWVSLGSYWLDTNNTQKYNGHNLINLSLNLPIERELTLFASINNLTNKQFAESASRSGTSAATYAPGMPRTIYAGIRYNWGQR